MEKLQENIVRIKKLMLVENETSINKYIDIVDSEDNNPNNLEIEFIQKNRRFAKMLNTILFELYKDNLDWNEDKSKFGIVGVYTLNDFTNWSILNYFGGHKFVKNRLLDNFKKSNQGDTPKDFYQWIIDNKETLLKDGPLLKELIRTNMNTYNKGSITEKYVIEKLKNKGFNIKYYPPGSTQDRDQGIDIEVNGNSFQVKEFTGMSEKDGKILLNTPFPKNYLGMDVQRIMLVNISNGDFVSFPNKDYIIDIKDNCYVLDLQLKSQIKSGNFNKL
jgi:hypothetical protein